MVVILTLVTTPVIVRLRGSQKGKTENDIYMMLYLPVWFF